MSKRIESFKNYEANIQRRKQISVKSLNLKEKLPQWIDKFNPEEISALLRKDCEDIFNKDGLEDFMLYLVDFNRVDLMQILLTSGEMCLFYCTIELNKCLKRAKYTEMQLFLKKTLDELTHISNDDDHYN
jgi:hypothetical protein